MLTYIPRTPQKQTNKVMSAMSKSPTGSTTLKPHFLRNERTAAPAPLSRCFAVAPRSSSACLASMAAMRARSTASSSRSAVCASSAGAEGSVCTGGSVTFRSLAGGVCACGAPAFMSLSGGVFCFILNSFPHSAHFHNPFSCGWSSPPQLGHFAMIFLLMPLYSAYFMHKNRTKMFAKLYI